MCAGHDFTEDGKLQIVSGIEDLGYRTIGFPSMPCASTQRPHRLAASPRTPTTSTASAGTRVRARARDPDAAEREPRGKLYAWNGIQDDTCYVSPYPDAVP